MRLFQMEFYKIANRRILQVGIIALLVFFGFYFWVGIIGDEGVYVDGKAYTRFAAIKMDKEITRQYEGVLTREKAEQIIDTYGWAPDWQEISGKEKGLNDNYANRFVTDNFSTRRYDVDTPVSWSTGEEASWSEDLLKMKPEFGYAGGWDEFQETLIMVWVTCSILIIIAVSPVFSEEYSLRTAPVLLTTEYGKGKDVPVKMLAAFAYTAALYVLFAGFVFLLFAAGYGTEGLQVSAATSVGLLGYDGTLLAAILKNLGMGLVSMCLTAVITLFISARCAQTFSAVIWSVLAYLTPFILFQIIFSMLRTTRVVAVIRSLLRCMPFYLPVNETNILSSAYGSRYLAAARVEELLVIGVISIFAVWQASRTYRRKCQ